MDNGRDSANNTPKAPTFVQIDEACQRFVSDWQAGRRARIEDYLEGWEEPERSKLLYELLSIEIKERRSRGEQPSMEDEESRFEGTRLVVREAFERSRGDDETANFGVAGETLTMHSELANIRIYAEGGLGVVYAAEDRGLNRNLAVKFIHRRVADDEASRARFLLEAEVTSRLEHPGVVPVHGIGIAPDGRPLQAR